MGATQRVRHSPLRLPLLPLHSFSRPSQPAVKTPNSPVPRGVRQDTPAWTVLMLLVIWMAWGWTSKKVRASSEVMAAKEGAVEEVGLGQIVYTKVSGVEDRGIDAVQLKIFMLLVLLAMCHDIFCSLTRQARQCIFLNGSLLLAVFNNGESLLSVSS